MIQWKAKGELYYVSKKITRRYSLPVGVRLGSVWRKMEIKNYLRTCGHENDEIVHRKTYDEIPPKVEYSLTTKGQSVVPILQSICKWSGIFYNDDSEHTMAHCQKCDYR